MAIVVNLDVVLAKRKMRLNDLAEAVGITPQNLSVLKSGRAKAIRFSTLDAVCRVLGCQPGDLLEHVPDAEDPRVQPKNREEEPAAPSGRAADAHAGVGHRGRRTTACGLEETELRVRSGVRGTNTCASRELRDLEA